ncbi:E3 ubiquitin-protein ligase MARCH5 [Astathelohania contejeani]|uniref:E3 ubiquitin-protein ligase MARCH5 n=1 Tax=Astathelohania contejeani TaxID=164912 RepID=A0ABQ7HZ16_9MICR|nr:E3 ubiquitin-protein ligase MARCH5 [Thelohania contejeani]
MESTEETSFEETTEICNRKDLICKICYLNKNPINSQSDFIAPCGCRGSIKYVHRACLKLWRFKEKGIQEIKRCEQCCQEYMINDEVRPYTFLIRISALITLLIMFIGCHYIINSFSDAISLLTEDTIYPNNESIFFYLEQHPDTLIKTYLEKTKWLHQQEIIHIGFMGSAVITIIIYQLFFGFHLITAFNYFFTLWRIFQFKFKFDYFILFCMSVYYSKLMYDSFYKQIEYLSIYLLNYRS